MRHSEILVAQAQVQRKSRSQLQIILSKAGILVGAVLSTQVRQSQLLRREAVDCQGEEPRLTRSKRVQAGKEVEAVGKPALPSQRIALQAQGDTVGDVSAILESCA